jgi:N-acetylglutamate synthase-like GNAT family acetyltransferase
MIIYLLMKNIPVFLNSYLAHLVKGSWSLLGCAIIPFPKAESSFCRKKQKRFSLFQLPFHLPKFYEMMTVHKNAMILRPAQPDDFPAIRNLVQRGKINPFGLLWSRFWVVVNLEGRIVACGQVKPHWDGSHELASIVVDPAHRGRGLARWVIEKLIEENPGTLYLTCKSSIAPMYEKFDFKEITFGEQPSYFRFLRLIAYFLLRVKVTRSTIKIMIRKTNEASSVGINQY